MCVKWGAGACYCLGKGTSAVCLTELHFHVVGDFDFQLFSGPCTQFGGWPIVITGALLQIGSYSWCCDLVCGGAVGIVLGEVCPS